MRASSSVLGLYVHIPFCSVKCFYCDFAAFSGQKAATRRYLRALEREAGFHRGAAPETLYIGGGTPSELDAAQIEELFGLLGRAFPSSRWREVTFEANPESLDAAKLGVLRRAGVTRLSLGLQTADDALLKAIGRRHSWADFLRVHDQARAAGDWALSVDLMYGLPDQTLESCLGGLDRVLALRPEHLSLYGLQVEDRTLFSRRGVEPDEDLGRRMFEGCLERIDRAGLRHYEISNFALPGRESVHNLNYWRDGDYIGLGCSAASHLNGLRSSNFDRLLPYCEAVEAGRRPTAQAESLSGVEKLGEKAFLGLRLIEGFVPGEDSLRAFAAQWDLLERRGLVERDGPRRRLTRGGVFLANDAFSQFVPPFEAAAKTQELSEALS